MKLREKTTLSGQFNSVLDLLSYGANTAFLHPFGKPRDDGTYILDTFSIVKRKDEATHGYSCSKDTILEIYADLSAAQETSQPYATRLDSPLADLWYCHPTKPTIR